MKAFKRWRLRWIFFKYVFRVWLCGLTGHRKNLRRGPATHHFYECLKCGAVDPLDW